MIKPLRSLTISESKVRPPLLQGKVFRSALDLVFGGLALDQYVMNVMI